MKHLLTHLLCVTLCFLPTACGFAPLYGEHTTLQQVSVKHDPNTREAQLLAIALEDLFPSQQENTPYQLHFALNHANSAQVIEKDGEITRYKQRNRVAYKLLENGKTVLTDTVDVYGSYDTSETDFSTYMANQDVRYDSMAIAAQKIRNRVARFLAQQNQ